MKLTLAMLLSAVMLFGSDPIPSTQAKDHVGETATVCGHVADSRYVENGSHVTFLNFDNRYPNHSFTGFIPSENRTKFGTPEKDYLGKDICITGKIQNYNGKPEIVLSEPQQIKMQSK
jgi:DNA/RNA endonuclease YhcR with UshA esterase domain